MYIPAAFTGSATATETLGDFRHGLICRDSMEVLQRSILDDPDAPWTHVGALAPFSIYGQAEGDDRKARAATADAAGRRLRRCTHPLWPTLASTACSSCTPAGPVSRCASRFDRWITNFALTRNTIAAHSISSSGVDTFRGSTSRCRG